MEELNESLLTMTLSAQDYGTSCGFNIYSNNDLEDEFINIIKKSSLFNLYFNVFVNLVRNKKIVLGYQSGPFITFVKTIFSGITSVVGSITSFFTDKLSLTDLGETVAFYCHYDDKVYIYLKYGKVITNLGNLPESEIVLSLTHELSHVLAKLNPRLFYAIYLKDLTNYYANVINSLDTNNLINWSSNEFKLLSNTIIKIKEDKLDPQTITENWKGFFNSVIKDATKQNEMNKLISKFLIPAIPFLTGKLDFNTTYEDTYKESIKAYHYAYQKLFNIDSEMLPGQEIFAPSEVIAVINTYKPNPKIVAAIKELKRIHNL